MSVYLKDPDATTDYVFDFTAWLGTGETITQIAAAIDDPTPSSLTVDGTPAEADGIVRVRVTGGDLHTDYRLRCRVTTSIGRIDDRSATIRVRER